MDQARFNEFVQRISDETPTLENHYTENPEMAHNLRVADAISTVFNLEQCGGMRQHWNCLTMIQHISRQLYSLAIIRPQILEEIYEDFKEDFKETLPEDAFHYGAVETREYPIPPELLNG